MQFIPSTWQLVGRDGNGNGDGDGTADRSISTTQPSARRPTWAPTAVTSQPPKRWTDAIYSSNQFEPYIRQVRAQATAYAAKSGTAEMSTRAESPWR